MTTQPTHRRVVPDDGAFAAAARRRRSPTVMASADVLALRGTPRSARASRRAVASHEVLRRSRRMRPPRVAPFAATRQRRARSRDELVGMSRDRARRRIRRRRRPSIGVLTIGLPAAMYSSVFVGLMKRVDSFSANGSRHTSQPARNRGRSSYGLLPEVMDVRRAAAATPGRS